MTTPDDEHPDLVLLCGYCTPRWSPVEGRVFRDCEWCRARLYDAWCECLYCEWIEDE